MTLSNPLLDFAIGMIAFFLVASLLVTALQEAIAQLFDIRAKTLRAAIGKMLDGDKKGGAATEDFFNHPLIESLNTRKPGIGPSYIPRDVFTEVMRQTSIAATATTSFIDAAKALPVDGSPAQAVLKGLAINAELKAGDFEKAVGDWFDAAMERVSGFYKRKAQMLAFGLGLAIAASANLNAVAVGGFLADNSAARDTIAEAVSASMQQKNVHLTQAEALEQIERNLKKILAQQAVPMGWSKLSKDALPNNVPWGSVALAYLWMIWNEGVLKGALLGWLVTALATTLGAAFWFDLLNRFVNIRATGPKPRKGEAPEV